MRWTRQSYLVHYDLRNLIDWLPKIKIRGGVIWSNDSIRKEEPSTWSTECLLCARHFLGTEVWLEFSETILRLAIASSITICSQTISVTICLEKKKKNNLLGPLGHIARDHCSSYWLIIAGVQPLRFANNRTPFVTCHFFSYPIHSQVALKMINHDSPIIPVSYFIFQGKHWSAFEDL